MDTLVLDSGYKPVDQISWQRAVTLWFLGKIRILEEYDDREIRSVGFAMKVPSVVQLVVGIVRRRDVRFSRENVYARDKGACAYCGLKVARDAATYDHVIPRSRGGTTRWDNIVIACVPCNQHKGARTVEAAGLVLKVRPEKPRALPPTPLRLHYTKATLPPSWEIYLRDAVYWHGELDQE